MFKKAVLLSVMATFALSATDTQVVDFFKTKIPPQVVNTLDIKAISREKVPNSDIDMVKLEIKSAKRTDKVTLFTHKNYIMQDIIDIKSGGSYQKILQEKALKAVVEKEKKENFVYLGDPKNPLITIFSDPECPYCRKELANIEDKLKTTQIRLILTPVHKRPSMVKSVLIYKETKNAKTDADKIKIIRKYFAKDVKVEQKVSDKDVKVVEDLRKKYFANGLKGVPFVMKH